MERAALYIRVSTDDQAEYSPTAQRKALYAYAQRNNMSIDPDHIYVDEGFSGRSANKRPAFMRMVGAAKGKPKPFDVILVHKFDRFARNREDSVVYKSLLRSKCGIKVISITEHMEDDKFSIILESMLEAMAEFYSINLSEEVKKGMTEKATRGELQSRPCYGYTSENNQLVIVEDEARYVRMIFDKYLEGEHSLFRLAKIMNDLGARTKTGKRFENRTLEYILRNPAYTGKLAWTPTKHKKRDFTLEDTIITPSTHEAIISDADFAKTQEQLDTEKAKNNYKRRPSYEFKHWLSGMLRCSECGASLVYNGNKNYPGFQCRSYAGGKCAVSHSVTLKKIEPAVIDGIKSTFTSSNSNYHTVQRPQKTTNEKALLEKQLLSIDDKLQRAKNAYLEGIDTAEEYKQNKGAIQQEKEDLIKRINGLKIVKMDEAAFKRKLEQLYDILTSPTASLLAKSNALHESVSKIIYNKATESVDIYYYI